MAGSASTCSATSLVFFIARTSAFYSVKSCSKASWSVTFGGVVGVDNHVQLYLNTRLIHRDTFHRKRPRKFIAASARRKMVVLLRHRANKLQAAIGHFYALSNRIGNHVFARLIHQIQRAAFSPWVVRPRLCHAGDVGGPCGRTHEQTALQPRQTFVSFLLFWVLG